MPTESCMVYAVIAVFIVAFWAGLITLLYTLFGGC
jgi:hypothetical protein